MCDICFSKLLSAATGVDDSIIPKVEVDWLILDVDAYNAGTSGKRAVPTLYLPQHTAIGCYRVNLLSESHYLSCQQRREQRIKSR